VLATVPSADRRWDNRPVAAAVLATWSRRARPLAPLAVVAFGIGALIVVGAARIPTTTGITTYAGMSRTAYAFDLAAGLSILAAGSVALLDEATAAVGRFAFAAGIVWFAQDWEGWHDGPALVRSLAAVAVPLLVVPPAFLAVGRRSRVLVAAASFLCSVAVVRAVVRDPLFDPHCWRDCVSRSLVVHSAPGLTRALDHVWLGTTIVIGGLVVLIAVRSLAAGTWPARRALAPTLVPGALACGVVGAYAAALLARPLEDPGAGLYSTLFYLRAVAFAVLAAGIVLAAARRWRQRFVVSRLTDELGAVPDTLADAFGDPTLQVAYWLPNENRYVGSDGRPVEPPAASSSRAITSIVRGGRPVAVVSHDAAFPVSRELGSSARLALENARLGVEVRAQLEALRRSRMRITERSDSERRRLERDLHDGAQQRLLALSFDLRLARSAAEEEGDERVVATLGDAVAEAQVALEELRELAHGIYPAILGEAGLTAALESLADDASVPVELSLSGERYDAPVEAALYVAVQEAVADAARRGATWTRVVLDGRATLAVDDNGTARSAPLVHVADRVGALGGETWFGANTLRAEIPCG
jgi:signal transduction histidine kinase